MYGDIRLLYLKTQSVVKASATIVLLDTLIALLATS
ncbi:MAG: hypothetical protein Ct9H300mP15_17020 [Gemmatimonadota bacterium]|nr:MAG: hypothetical protein Ct9H300mP15_17020 [Gemmatimonadota bacterium]